MSTESPTFSRNDDRRRFEAELDGIVAYADFHQLNERLTFLHTEVPRELEGRGVGGGLIRWALDGARRDGMHVVPVCPFVANWIRRHREYADLVRPEFRHLIG